MTGKSGTAISNSALMVFAHADDETLLAGALIPKLVHGGWRVHLLCIAPGDDSDRSARMELAAAELGVDTVSFLRFSPTAIPGETRSSTVPKSRAVVVSPELRSAPEQAVISLIEGKIAAAEPSMIITHSPAGDYGHPDHALCHRLTVAAAASAAPSAAVYALAWPRTMLWLNSLAERLIRARNARPADTGAEEDADATGVQNTRLAVTQIHDVRGFLSARKRAARHYKKEVSQGPLPLRLLEAAPVWLQWPVLGKVRLSRVR